MRYLLVLIFLIPLIFPPAGESAQPPITTTIDRFVSNLYPKGSHYFWVVNNTSTESPEEMIIDINTNVRNTTEDTLKEDRYLLLLIKGKLFAAQKIPLDATVDCEDEEEI